VLAARKLGMANVPCVYADDLSENERMAYILADNKIAENATWDQAILNIELDDLFSRGFDLQIAGFSKDEITHTEDEPSPKEPNVKVGRFEILLQCSDESEQEMIFEEMQTREIKCVML
jgi:ParB-like chromosome segregation protein Spo0J